MPLAMIQDELMPLEAVPIPFRDRAMYFGDGVYEVIRSYKGHIFALEDHLMRFANSLEAVDIRGITVETVRQRVLTAFDQAGIGNAKIYFHVTRGSGPRDPVEAPGLAPNFYLTITELEDATLEKTQGISVITHPDLRWKRCDIKSLNLLPNVLAKREAHKQGCDEAILVDDQGLITEGSASAFFAICGDSSAQGDWPGLCLRTTALHVNILPSVTRKYVIKSAQAIGLTVVERSVAVPEAKAAQELFLAVTTRDIVPIVKFDGQSIGQGKPGKATQALMQAFQQCIDED
ncbi:MAG: aminotransferase class IV [Phycisphaerae bacterium]|nr:aminotransferase class IV [Phycisphaerae bacterium]